MRTFLLYSEPLVLKNVLPNNKYEHFLLLHNVILVLYGKQYTHLLDVAQLMLETFVKDYDVLYGAQNITYVK